jgi:hypothetical protein
MEALLSLLVRVSYHSQAILSTKALDEFARIKMRDATADAIHKSFPDRLDGKRHDDLVGDLAGLAVAGLAHARDVLAHQREQRSHLLEQGRAPTHHDGERGRLGADLAAGNRRIEIIAAKRSDSRRILQSDRSATSLADAHATAPLSISSALDGRRL